ncbi:GNAT family N-acetyltransferase [Gordonia paraffinivorans]|uniref:GNAT family N-acetyltransferase n=1 Tax=Gordonia paraffinivorans TaxID=175628 RepID=UPI00242A51A8|nr:GNAT family N-acetyltransferase [Gordonia paraffinivorans]
MTSVVHRSPSADIDASTLYRILRLRVDVFVVEQACPYPELDGRDLEPTTRQFWITENGEPDGPVVSTLRLLKEPTPAADGGLVYRIGRACTAHGHRGRGLLAELMTTALAEVGDRPCRIEAQAYLTEMYGKFGFVAESEEYLEDGIPHVSMIRAGRENAGE